MEKKFLSPNRIAQLKPSARYSQGGKWPSLDVNFTYY